MTANFDGASARDAGAGDPTETLLGAYALDAVSNDERREVEALLDQSPSARAELATMQIAVDALAAEAASAPPMGTWERLLDRLSDDAADDSPVSDRAPSAEVIFPAGALPGPVRYAADSDDGTPLHAVADVDDSAPASAPVDELSKRRAVRTASTGGSRGWPLMVAAAAIVAVLMLGGLVVRQGTRIDNLSSEMAAGGVERSAQQALADPSSELVDLAGGDLKVNVRAAVTEDGTGYLFAEDLPELPDDQTYQLWAARDDNVVSVGVLGNRPRVSAFQTATDAKALAITVESAGGVVRSDHDPVAAGEFT